MYIEQFCLAVLFFLKISDGIAFLAEGVLMLVLMAVTLSAQLLYQNSFDREHSYSLLVRQSFDTNLAITHYLPMSLATQKLQERWEHHKKAHGENEEQDKQDLEDVDLFSRDRKFLFMDGSK